MAYDSWACQFRPYLPGLTLQEIKFKHKVYRNVSVAKEDFLVAWLALSNLFWVEVPNYS